MEKFNFPFKGEKTVEDRQNKDLITAPSHQDKVWNDWSQIEFFQTSYSLKKSDFYFLVSESDHILEWIQPKNTWKCYELCFFFN